LRYTVELNVDEIEMYSLIGSALKTVTKAVGEVVGGVGKALLG
jgi:predicted GTPase